MVEIFLKENRTLYSAVVIPYSHVWYGTYTAHHSGIVMFADRRTKQTRLPVDHIVLDGHLIVPKK